ncbi:EGF-like protein [Cavenderia fasciculata]|uniref:EGF-like protein n=1 Tax=Cavenderia fasciculata TaxID=261658 RepID=F4PIS7_CACFS|nr:EGF-like protein [Cavenderia fasciculata]EGG24656.1 EGF-like protein [Cavenderia fasciculata]|eukprot:XP_004362507.1 EGF-like protein [Cavenderia fasciculata]
MSNSQVIPDDERMFDRLVKNERDKVASAIFLIRQYGRTIAQDQTLCTTTTEITCGTDTFDGQYRITAIVFLVGSFTDVGIPEPTTVLSLPALVIFRVDVTVPGTPVSNPSLNVLEQIKHLKNLTSIVINSDPTCTAIPADFINFDKLNTIVLGGNGLTVIPPSFLDGANSELVSITIDEPISQVSIIENRSFPKLYYLTLTTNCILGGPCIINVTSTYYPNLSRLEIQMLQNSYINVGYYININTGSNALVCNDVSNGAQCHLTIGYPSYLSILQISGQGSTYSPPIDASSYSMLYDLRLERMGLTTFPLASYPPLSLLNLIGNSISTIPSLPVPASLQTLRLKNNLLTTLDFSMFSNNNGLDLLELSGNTNFATITNQYCKHKISILSTAVTTVPDCFWCYSGLTGVLISDLQRPANFNCVVKINAASNLLATNMGSVIITGENLGYGHQDFGYRIIKMIPNAQMHLSVDTIPMNPTNYTLKLSSFVNPPTLNVTVVEGIVSIQSVSAQETGNSTIIKFHMISYNPYFSHTVLIGTTLCANITDIAPLRFDCTVPPLATGVYTVRIYNSFYEQAMPINFTFSYPVVNAITPLPALMGSNITLAGYFGLNFINPSISFMDQSGGASIAECDIKVMEENRIICQSNIAISNNARVLVEINSINTTFIITPQYICQQRTNNCSGNGQCDAIQGVCICKSNAFYNDCSKPYPIISSASYDSTNTKNVILNGDFGPYTITNSIIKINNTLDCAVSFVLQQLINCTLGQSPNYGLSSVHLEIYSATNSIDTTVRNILYLRPPTNNNGGTTTTTTTSTTGGSLTPQEQCEKDTFNCYGHGKCDINGICQCDDNYNPVDNCFTKFSNTTIKPNTTSPTVSFDIDGIDFQFEIVSIQELDLDAVVLKELFISNYSWNVNVSSNNIITIVNYQLNTTTNSSSSSPSSSFQSVLVSSTISFSTQSRDIQFGDQTLHINPNSIKLAVNITNWQYSSNLATLRVVFRTIINNNQTVEYDCEDKNVEPLTYDSVSSLQYLRVVKDNVQFNGRFIDFALSDGRPTYSQTQLISLSQHPNNDEQSIAMIGINFPQCKSCVLDPDFTPLLIDKENDSGCGDDSKSNTWRIIVGAVVGGVGAVAIVTASIITIKKIQKRNKFNAHVQNNRLCSLVFFCENLPDGFTHITQISIIVNTFTNVGIPDPNTVLDLPYLRLFNLLYKDPSKQVANQTINLLEYMRPLTNLTSINIVSDPSLTYLPTTGFDSRAKLEMFTVDSINIRAVPEGFLNNSIKLNFLQFLAPIESIVIDDSYNFPSLKTLQIHSNRTTASLGLHFLNITTKSFPILENCNIVSLPGSNTTVYHSISNLNSLYCGALDENGGDCHLVIGNPQSSQFVTVRGHQSTLSPFPIVGSDFPELKFLTLGYMDLVSWPVQSYPPKLVVLNLSNNKFTTVSPLPVPKSVSNFMVADNELTGVIDIDSIFSNNNGGVLSFENNLGLDQPLSNNNYCKHQLYIRNTSIPSVPPCFWCYKEYRTTGFVVFETDLSLPSGFTCPYNLNVPMLVTSNKTVNFTGSNVGWGRVQTPNYTLTSIIPNNQMVAVFDQAYQYPTLFPFKLAPFVSPPLVNINVIEGGVKIGNITTQQTPNVTTIIVTMSEYNSYFSHFFVVDASTTCTNISNPQSNKFVCQVPPLTSGIHQLSVWNDYYSQALSFSFDATYPNIIEVTGLPSPLGSNITLTGNFGTLVSGLQVSILNGRMDTAQCVVKSVTTTTIICETGMSIVNTQVDIIVDVDGYQASYLVTLFELCTLTTNNCHGNGVCDHSGDSYPIISSASYDSTNNKLVTLNGDFGPYPITNVMIKINNTLNCTGNDKSQFQINCTLEQSPPFGLSSVYLQLNNQVDGLNTTARNILILRPTGNGGGSTTTTTTTTTTSTTSGGSSNTPQQQCEKDTFNCYGHGKCDNNGICQCDDNYNPVDNCFTKFTNTTIKPNTTDPTVSFDIDGIDFQFEIVSIQELDLDGNTILKELFISNYSWNVNVSSNNIITIVNYQLNTTTNSSSSSPSSSSSFQSVLVLSTISFSTQSRDIQFGDQTLHINPNSIKLAVNITNWQYSSNLATLRVVFRTIINNNQSVEYECEDKQIESLTYDSLSSLQYLRVVKDNVQFNGRFIDFALSDGRPTYSQTQLISLTQSDGGDDEQSIVMIGVGLPQCNECVLDPDFTPLLIDKSECGHSDSWRIIVGAVVGGVGGAAIIVASVLTYLKIRKGKIFDQRLSVKMKGMGQ